MAIARDDIIASLNLDPSGTRATDAEKDKRIELALRACQRLHYNLPTLAETLNPDGLAAWKFGDASAGKDVDEHKLEKRFGIVSYMEANRNSMGITNQTPTVFEELRQTLMCIGMASEENPAASRCIVIQDKDQESGICLRVADVREVHDPVVAKSKQASLKDQRGQPVLVVFFNHDDRTRMDPQQSNSLPWLSKVLDKKEASKRGIKSVRNVTASPTEQHMLLRALEGNAVRLESSYTGPKGETARWLEEEGWKVSFLLPMAPLNAEYLARYQVAPACAAEGCGKEAWSSCAACGITWYCSRDCQTAGWSSHKTVCKESADAPHYLVKLQKEQAQYAMKMNVNDCAVDTLHGRALMPSRQRAKIAVPDKYGKKRFVVKLQSPLDIGPAASSAPIMLNDPTREMEGQIYRKDCSDYAQIIKLMREKGRDQQRLFMYAQRVDDGTLKLYHQNLPSQQLRW